MNKGIFFALVLVTFSMLYVAACTSTTTEEPHKPTIDYNYVIDLKMDYYIVFDEYDGSIDTVAFGNLEQWFLDDNL
jgi:hypothetical protein